MTPTPASIEQAIKMINEIDQLIMQHEYKAAERVVAAALDAARAEERERIARQLEGFATKQGDDHAAAIRALKP